MIKENQTFSVIGFIITILFVVIFRGLFYTEHKKLILILIIGFMCVSYMHGLIYKTRTIKRTEIVEVCACCKN